MSEKEKRFFMVLPVLVLPFLTMAFWALGGGGTVATASAEKKAGLLTSLPDVKLADAPADKLSYYSRAEADSLKREEEMKLDPYARPVAGPEIQAGALPGLQGMNGGLPPSGQLPGYSDPDAAKVYERLNALNAALNQPQASPASAAPPERSAGTLDRAEVDRLEQMMNMMQGGQGESDPEMQQLGGMLESILDLQHPERVQERLKAASSKRKGEVFSVAASQQPDAITSLSAGLPGQKGNGFFTLDASPGTAQQENGIRAVVHENQTLSDGAIVKLRLSCDIYINGVRIPKDNFLFGLARLDGERLTIKIEHIRYGQSLFPVSLAVFDVDGLEGIHVPGAIGRDVAKESGANALQGLSLSTLDPSIGAQAAGVGLELGRSFLGKKVKKVKVTVKAGYAVLLIDEKKRG